MAKSAKSREIPRIELVAGVQDKVIQGHWSWCQLTCY